ncbi:DUF3574 domain-containing protein [Hydrocarboniphaga sp.]|uniref:DUF3574 domain-containing protein n=1 Tax=Hydrocarboniphaga sp. TaxID=2033016 RepID=UPI003D0D0CB4
MKSLVRRVPTGAAVLLLLLLAGCVAPTSLANRDGGVSSRLQGDAAHPAQAQNWIRTELYFGTGPADDAHQGIDEAAWRAFLDREITPRFASGLSVFDIYGQWQDKGAAAPERLRSKVVVLLHESNADKDAKIEQIRSAWKKLTGDLSVLRVSQPAEVSF